MKATPLAQVKEQFGSKEDLVKAIEKLAKSDLWLDRVNDDKGLLRASNAKLLHLHSLLSEVKDAFGSRDKLIDAICEAEKRTDDGYKEMLATWPTPRLWDWYQNNKKAKLPTRAKKK